VTSSRAATPTRAASYSTMPLAYSSYADHKGSFDTGSTTGQPHRWSINRASARSSGQYPRSSAQSFRRPQTPEVLDHNRESMKALSDFLMTRQPPPDHWMSMNSSEDEKSIGSFKRSAFKVLGRKKKKKEKPVRLLQLPDSAVAATTTGGARYIAISIPIEHDSPREPTVQPPHPARQSLQRPGDRGSVTVLKPVAEVRESSSMYLSGLNSTDRPNEPAARVPAVVTTPPPMEIVGQDKTEVSQSCYMQQRRPSAVDIISTAKREPGRVQKSYVAISPAVVSQQEPNRRHSGGTAYSITSVIAGQTGHSRVPSNASTDPSMTVMPSLKPDLPQRNSSISRGSRSPPNDLPLNPLGQNPVRVAHRRTTERTPANLNLLVQNPARGVQGIVEHPFPKPIPITERGQARVSAVSTQTGVNSVTTGASRRATSTGSTPSPPPNVFTAETARKYSNAGNGEGPQLVRSTTPRNLSRGSIHLSRPVTAPLPQSQIIPTSQFNETANVARRTLSQKEGHIDARQDPQERVKAVKQRDMVSSKPKSSSQATPTASQESTSNISAGPYTATTLALTKRSSKRHRNSGEIAQRRNSNTITPVMLVASLPPLSNFAQLSPPISCNQSPSPTSSIVTSYSSTHSQYRSHPKGKKPSNISRTSSVNKTHTPPRSYTSSIAGSETDESVPYHPGHSQVARLRVSSQSLRSTLLETRRQERREKRNLSLREKDLDDRIERIERDNMLLLRTLNGIAKSLGQMRLTDLAGGIERRRSSKRAWIGPVDADEERRLGELEKMDDFMRDLQQLAPRVSMESLKRRERDTFDEFDDVDRGSIL
jgi:hypothetical protein